MSATRLLVLGVVRGYGRAHGYLIGNDLMSWGADVWANVKWGSIYHALKQGVKAGFLNEDWTVPGRTDYELTEKGEFEFQRLLADALRKPEPRPDMLAAGVAMLPALTRDQALSLLELRLAVQESIRKEADHQLTGWREPPHVRELYRLRVANAAGDAAWTRELIDRLRAGEYAMADDPGSVGKAGSWPHPA
ncbi:PadR family transcriptional regulator [Kutzneria kofuensis]|uniref:DNA-binding PadR family transcriptional regulator n=1 Tax=Kutzneria kofuensis TaxID=103725 RepID=A0A7W9NFV3_9PSEU|nr:PadR family transcriptional regulator [Kutzneria kofuensis]MBB5891832.1 DNA-binding PadR family transcriptional regulator [Kutzneria kofuensis]